MKLRSLKLTSILIKILPLLLLIIIWSVASWMISNELILPNPLQVFFELGVLFKQGNLIFHTAISVVRMSVGLVISILLGLTLGMALAWSDSLRLFIEPLILMMQSIPVVVWLLLGLIWLDQSLVPTFVIMVATIPILAHNTQSGINRVNNNLLEMAEVFHLDKKSRLFKIIIPSVAGYLSASARVIAGTTLKAAVMGEVLAHPGSGLGEMLFASYSNLETTTTLAWTVWIFILSAILYSGVKRLEGNQ